MTLSRRSEGLIKSGLRHTAGGEGPKSRLFFVLRLAALHLSEFLSICKVRPPLRRFKQLAVGARSVAHRAGEGCRYVGGLTEIRQSITNYGGVSASAVLGWGRAVSTRILG